MRRLIDSFRSKSCVRMAGVSALIALPVVAPGALAVAITSLSIKPSIVPSGASAAATVNITPSAAVTRVDLLSTNTSVARVPTSINVPAQQKSAQFTVTAFASGCAAITAVAGRSKESALIYVRPRNVANNLTLTLAADSVFAGTSTSGTVIMPSAQVVQLSTNNPNVTVPPSVTLNNQGDGFPVATFPIASAMTSPHGTCAVITATSGSNQKRALVRVVSLVQG